MNQSSLNMLLDADHNAYLYHDHLTSMCLYACDYAIYRHLAVNSPSANKILREFQSMKPFPCSSCPYSKEWQEKQREKAANRKRPVTPDIPPFTCSRGASQMIVPKTRYPLNYLFADVSAQDVLLARKGVDAWADKYHYTPARKKPERVNEVWFSDHHPLDLFVITQVRKDGTFDTARVWLTAVMDAASNAMVGYTLTTRPNTASIAEAFARAAVFTVDSPFYALPEIIYIDNGKDYCSELLNGELKDNSGCTNKRAGKPAQLVKKLPSFRNIVYNRRNGGVFMEQWRKDTRNEAIIVDLEALVPQDHLLRKIEKVMDYEWLYERLAPYYCHTNGRPGTDPVVLIKMVLIQHLFGIPSLRQTYREIEVNVAYRWFLGYSLLDKIPHFATVSYAFCQRFPEELSAEIFEHILNKALNYHMVDPSIIFIDGTHIKASANKKKSQKVKVEKTAKVYAKQLREEVNAEREKLGQHRTK